MHIKSVIFLLIISTLSFAVKPTIVNRNSWTFSDNNTTASGKPSELKFLKYYDVLPDEISIKILNKRDLSSFVGKHIFVGYGTINPHGHNCRVFPSSVTGMDNNVTICLPWWRIERTYQKSVMNVKDLKNIICELPTPRPPIKVDVCKEWAKTGDLSTTGGKVTCTSYYNKLESPDCWKNPKQAKCFVNNCSIYTQNNCTFVQNAMGTTQNLITAENKGNGYEPTATKIDVLTHQYNCPAGTITPFAKCKSKQSVLMYPYECKPDDKNTLGDNSIYIYCDENKPIYDPSNGQITGFLGKCPADENHPKSRNVVCDVNVFSQTTKICTEPLNAEINTTSFSKVIENKTYKEVTVDVLSGEPDIYASKPNCVRANTVGAARNRIIQAHIKGAGNLDDDIWVFRHRGDGTHFKVYCNEQHNENAGSKKVYDGVMEQCIDNNGNYSFNKNINIDSTDIVSVQQVTERENTTGTPFSGGRTNYGSSKVTIDGKIVAPEVFPKDYPYYPNDGHWLHTWENSLGTLSILFPYAGAYQISFFNKEGNLVTQYSISRDDFDDMRGSDYIQLKLAKHMEYAPDFDKNSSTACLDDDWAEWGGGVYNGKNSKTGATCQTPNDSFSKSHAIYKVIVKDLLTGNITPIPLIYPLAYPNRVFISKLKLYELRKYRCYDKFSEDVPK